MRLYPAVSSAATAPVAGWPCELASAGIVAIRVADLRSLARHGAGKDGRTALTAEGAGQIRTGDMVVFCKPGAVAGQGCGATAGCGPPGIPLITPGSGSSSGGWRR